VYLLPYAVLVVPLATSTFPRLAARAAAGRHVEFARMASATTRAVVLAAGVGAAAVAAAAPAVADVFGSLGRHRESVAAMAPAITLLLPGLLGFSVMFHASRALYALERGRLAVTANVAGWGTSAVASVVLAAWLVPAGEHDSARTLVALAVASSVGMLVGGTAAVAGLRRAAGPEALRGLGRSLVVVVLSGVVAAGAGRWVVDSVGSLVGHGVGSAIAAAVGGALVAVVVVGAGIALLDRGTVTGFVRLEREPAPADASLPPVPDPAD
jgi:putative peptidoglycan lipid II flippase